MCLMINFARDCSRQTVQQNKKISNQASISHVARSGRGEEVVHRRVCIVFVNQ